jgi:hypothetical protein
MKKLFVSLAILTAAIEISAQGVFPPERQGGWDTAGYSATQRYIPRFSDSIDVTTLGLHGDGNSGGNDNSLLLNTAITNRTNPATFIFPAGKYIFNNQIKISGKNSIVLRGAGSDKTTFEFHCPLTANPTENPSIVPCSFGHLIYLSSSRSCGIENLKVTKVNYPNDGADNIMLAADTGCWVYGVESFKPMMFHIEISGGTHNVVRGCYVQDADYTGEHGIYYDENGHPITPTLHTHGYGINVCGGATACLVEDNACRYLRHGIAFDGSAHDNVASYNYVFDGHAYNVDWGAYYHDWDILFHGSYNNRNLFEGNVVDLLGADERNGGPCPYNTFFRNIAYCIDYPSLYDESCRFDHVANLNLIGNVITWHNTIVETQNEGCNNILDVYGRDLNWINRSHYEHLQVNDCGGWNDGRNDCESKYWLYEFSCYYTENQLAPGKGYGGESPDFWDPSVTWPAIGPRNKWAPLLTQKNPAKLRWERGEKLTVDAPPLKLLRISVAASRYIEPGVTGIPGTYKINGTNMGSVYRTGSWPYGQPLTVEAVATTNNPFCGWSDGSRENPRIMKPRSEIVIYALYKAIHKSNDSLAFSNNSQRKLIQTTIDGTKWLHQVYTSSINGVSHVWLEHSSDGGNTWILANYGRPLDIGGGKCPSIAFTKAPWWPHNYIGVVWQQPWGSTYTIQGLIYNQLSGVGGPPYPTQPITLYWEPVDPYTTDANPNVVLASGYSAPYLVIFERKSTSGSLHPGINWLVGFVQDGGTQEVGPFGGAQSQGIVAGTNANSINAQISWDPCFDNYAYTIGVNLIYQAGKPSGSIYTHYLYFTQNTGGGWEYYQYDDGMVSYPYANVSPSIVSLPNGYYAACWIEVEQLVYYYLGNPSVRYYYGTGVQSCVINRGGDNNGFAVWSQVNNNAWSNKSIRFADYLPSSSTIQTLNTTGKYVQLTNSVTSGLNNMYVSSFRALGYPFYFSTSQELGPLSKQSFEPIATGRGFIINKDDMKFSFRFDNLTIDGKNIAFVDAPDTLDYSQIDVLNNALITEPFQLNAGSKVIFTEMSGFTDSTAAVKVFGKDGYINYKIELIDHKACKVIGTIKNESLTSSNLHSFRMPSYSLNTKGLADKTVMARITVATNLIDPKVGSTIQNRRSVRQLADGTLAGQDVTYPQIILTKSITDANAAKNLEESSMEELAIDGLELPTSYALDQNYPNPFNPSTTINYQIPNAGHVTLKVYDMLGREVTTLVDGMKDIGSYSVTFSGEKLASGIYIVRIVAQGTDVESQEGKPFVKTMKMLLMK